MGSCWDMVENVCRAWDLLDFPEDSVFFQGIFLLLPFVVLLQNFRNCGTLRLARTICYTVQYDTAQHSSIQNNTIRCTIKYAFLGI